MVLAVFREAITHAALHEQFGQAEAAKHDFQTNAMAGLPLHLLDYLNEPMEHPRFLCGAHLDSPLN